MGLSLSVVSRCVTHAQAAFACGNIAKILNTWLGGCLAVPGHRKALKSLFTTASTCSQALSITLLRCLQKACALSCRSSPGAIS